ncbi:MAG: NAD(P)/FAD-dependent oxidoreductase [Synergistaceae bacterium]|jgi:NADPH-dependent 2,4-dienoyl-CoA reductase/sulfur reductase-like enzyme|nr:NAD(P)/FAD-dependent oxidoreductase [Synergistaceae bacterium]
MNQALGSKVPSVERDLVVIGGGPAGLAAAIAAKEEGCDVLLVERDRILGGILNQCIHDGFGLHRFSEALSGPEYAARFIERLKKLDIAVMQNTIVLNLSHERKILVSRLGELLEIRAKAVVLAMGCRERPRGALSIPGHRPSGVYTAGAAQNFVNMENVMPGRRICILGSGDIGLIMARRMTLEGGKVEAVFELLPWSSGLPRNIQQCLVDYDIPLYLSTTVVDIVGMKRLEAVRVAEVDGERRPIKSTERMVPCDTLLLSVGLIPENELAREAGIALSPVTGGPLVDERCMTNLQGVFSCGNALHVHDLVDWVSEEAERAGRAAAEYVTGKRALAESGKNVKVRPGNGVRYVMPDRLSASENTDAVLAFRVTTPARDGKIQVVLKNTEDKGTEGEEILKEEKHARLHPAEMIRVRLSPAEIAAAGKEKILEVRVP